jgi:capsular polysaccharide biosynthesis protein
MELRAYWNVIVRRWWLVLAPLAVVAVVVGTTYRRPPTSYQVVLRYAAGTAPVGASADYDRYYPWLTSEYIANGLADVAETGAFAQAVAARLRAAGMEVPAAAVQGAIATDNAQSILVVYLTWPDPAAAVKVADAITAELTENGAAYFPQLEGVEPAARLLDPPLPVALPPGLRAQLLGPAVKLALGLVAGVGLALLWHYIDPTVQEPADLERLGLPVLAEIPRRRWRVFRAFRG